MSIVVGLTGGIASGKTFVSNYLKSKKISIHESDEIVANLYKNPTKEFLIFLKKEGFEKSLSIKKIDKKIIRDEIFSNKIKKKKLENYIHKEVRKSREDFIKKNINKKIVFLDIPLLFEKKLEGICSYVCSILAPIKIRKSRALKRPGMKESIFGKIIKTQTTDIKRKEKSDYLIKTTKTKKETCLQVDNIIYDILIKQKLQK